MVTEEQLAKAKEFIFRHGRLLDRKYFLFHFGGGPGTAARVRADRATVMHAVGRLQPARNHPAR